MVKRFLGHYTRGSGFKVPGSTRNIKPGIRSGGVALREPANLDASRLVMVELSSESAVVT
jgi:hypothetical protein